jgi:molecular chaperone GrpE
MTQHEPTTAPDAVANPPGDEALIESLAAQDTDLGADPGAETDPEPQATPELEPEPAQLVALLEDARAKADETWDQLLRTRAEMENLQRRQARELDNAHKFALEGFVRELLQVRDSLELGYDAAHADGANLDKLREGTELTLKLMANTMAKFGVEAIVPDGHPFNPELHQAMTMVTRDDLPQNTVVNVVQKGYVLNGRLVRPAMVIVSRKA